MDCKVNKFVPDLHIIMKDLCWYLSYSDVKQQSGTQKNECSLGCITDLGNFTKVVVGHYFSSIKVAYDHLIEREPTQVNIYRVVDTPRMMERLLDSPKPLHLNADLFESLR